MSGFPLAFRVVGLLVVFFRGLEGAFFLDSSMKLVAAFEVEADVPVSVGFFRLFALKSFKLSSGSSVLSVDEFFLAFLGAG